MAIEVYKHKRRKPFLPDQTKFEKHGSYIIGWNDSGHKYNKEPQYPINEYLPGFSEDIDLYACWVSELSIIFRDNIPLQTIYDYNYSGAPTSEICDFYSDEAFTIKPNSITKPNSLFKEWNTNRDGTGHTYLINDLVSRQTDLNLYAQWVDGIFMEYLDDNNIKQTHFFKKEDIPEPLQVCDYLSPFELIEPFKSIAKTKTKILSFYDSFGELTSVGERSFIFCNNISVLALPGAKTCGGYGFQGLTNCKNLMISSINDITLGGTLPSCPKLTYCFVDSENRKSIPNTDKDKPNIYYDSLIVDKNLWESSPRKADVYVKVYGITEVDRDDIYNLRGYIFHESGLTSMNIPNVTQIAGSRIFPITLKTVNISNNVLSSITNGYDEDKTCIVGDNGKSLIKILPIVKRFRNNNITSIANWAFEESEHPQLTSIQINNDFFRTECNDTAIFSKDMTQLIHVLPYSDINLNDYPNISAIQSRCFSENRKLEEINMPSVKKLLTAEGHILRNAYVKRLILDNLQTTYCSFHDTGGELQYISLSSFDTIFSNQFAKSRTNNPQTTLSVNIPNAKTIGNTAFRQNCYIRRVDFNKAISIGDSSFERCLNLSAAYLNMCTSFGDNCFKDIRIGNVYNLKELHCGAVTKSYIQSNYQRMGIVGRCECYCKDGNITVGI